MVLESHYLKLNYKINQGIHYQTASINTLSPKLSNGGVHHVLS